MAISIEEARKLLGLPKNYSSSDAVRAYSALKSQLEARLSDPEPSFSEKNETFNKIAQIRKAYFLLIANAKKGHSEKTSETKNAVSLIGDRKQDNTAELSVQSEMARGAVHAEPVHNNKDAAHGASKLACNIAQSHNNVNSTLENDEPRPKNKTSLSENARGTAVKQHDEAEATGKNSSREKLSAMAPIDAKPTEDSESTTKQKEETLASNGLFNFCTSWFCC